MKPHRRMGSLRLWILTLLLCFAGSDAFSDNTHKVLIISSYGSDYQWSNSIIDGINLKLQEVYPGIELNVEYLSSELFANTENWKLKMNTILTSYTETPPLVIIFISDEAWMAYNSVDTKRYKDVPLLLCAVKPHSIRIDEYSEQIDNLRLSDFDSTLTEMKNYNATGVLREMNVPGYLSLMKQLQPKMDRLALVTDKRFYGIYTRLVFEEQAKRNFAHYPVEYLDARFVKTDSLLRRLPEITPSTGLLLTSWLTGEHGFEYSKDYIYKQMSDVLKTPIFITNDIGLEKGYFLGGYFNRAEFWGERTGQMLLSIIGGKSPREIEPVVAKDEQCHIHWRVLHRFDLSADNLPDDVVFRNKPESPLEKYKIQLSFLLAMFVIIIAAYIYTLRSHIRLQKAQKQTLQAIEETTLANRELQNIRKNLTVALKKAEESDRLKSAFLANMSHEIRTPLNAIVGFSELITTAESDQERTESAAIIKRSSDLLLQLISDILDISKIEAGALHFTYEQTDLNVLCEHTVASLRLKCKPGVTLSLSAPDQPIIAHTDQHRLTQALMNLIGNAMKFTDKGSIEAGYFAYGDDQVEFYVKDSGIGIAPDQLDKIFDRFFKLNSCIEGTGLGLSICKIIAENLGGSIGAESRPGEGSRFWFRIKRRME